MNWEMIGVAENERKMDGRSWRWLRGGLMMVCCPNSRRKTGWGSKGVADQGRIWTGGFKGERNAFLPNYRSQVLCEGK